MTLGKEGTFKGAGGRTGGYGGAFKPNYTVCLLKLYARDISLQGVCLGVVSNRNIFITVLEAGVQV